ncbi:MAG: DUF47 family protein [Christensenellaceae bacterium]|jgi:uncharacterized protein Yka (UPF0111/DUF47 family)|nr:DUF47 family protein [Christensenellaceae bacterium]
MAKKTDEYFSTFIVLLAYAGKAAERLYEALSEFRPETLKEQMAGLHEIEHMGDETKHRMMERLAEEFITRIDREDIVQLSNEMDEVIDKIEDILIRVYMYNIKQIRPEALRFADVIRRCCLELQAAVKEMPNFQKSIALHAAVVEVNSLEEEGDTLYVDAMRALYSEEGLAPITLVAWSETFDRFEECCDACEHLANSLERAAMKNS